MLNKKLFEFDWDKGNIDKNKKHNVRDRECEESFFDKNKVVLKDVLHTTDEEERYILLGKTRKGRFLYIVYTIRVTKIRIISARDINKKEVKLYEKTN